MPYINRYFHKREFAVPSRPYFQATPLAMEEDRNQKVVPRYVTAYEYAVQDNDSKNRDIANTGKRYTTEVRTKIANEHIYQFSQHDLGPSTMLQTYNGGSSSKLNLIAKIKAPSGTVQFCDIIGFDKNHFNIRFVPTEIGEHRVSVKCGNVHVPGSPFKFYVEHLEGSGCKNVKVSGKAIYFGYANEKNEFSISSREAGSGNLSVIIDGPSKALIEMIDRKDGTYTLRYIVPYKGGYQCSIKFNNEHIPCSPFQLTIIERNSVDQTQNETLAVTKNHGVVVGKPSCFTIKHCGFKGGLMRAFVVNPSRHEENAKINQLGDDHFSVQIQPNHVGIHNIHVLLDEKPISGSPFQIMVGEKITHECDIVDGPILETTKFIYEATQPMFAIEGPSKQYKDSYESDHGYEMLYVPTIQGEYIISPNHGETMPPKGSIFKMNLMGDTPKNDVSSSFSLELRSHPEHVKCHGEGINRAYFGRNNQFEVDVSSAGLGPLSVAVVGPTKHCENVNIRHVGEHRFHVCYVAQEYGNHEIIVRWGEEHISGSPFRVSVQ